MNSEEKQNEANVTLLEPIPYPYRGWQQGYWEYPLRRHAVRIAEPPGFMYVVFPGRYFNPYTGENV